MPTLHIGQDALQDGHYPIRFTLKRPSQPDLEAKAKIQFALTTQEQEELRWYMEDYLTRPESVEEVQVEQIEQWMKRRGEELYTKVLAENQGTQAIWFAVREQLADPRIEITTGIAEAASIPWELMRDPQSDSAITLRAQSFVRVKSHPNLSFVPVPPADEGRIRLLYGVCRPGGRNDVELRAVANRLLQDLGIGPARFDITALRLPTFEQLQKELTAAKVAGQVRWNIAVMYLDAAERESTPARQRDLLHRAQAYAQAALRDFQHYQGRAAADEAKAEELLADIAQALTKLPS